jgi:hypothetical protein
MKTTATLAKQEIWCRDYNLDKKDNLTGLPTESAVFGVFAIVAGEPVNCRYVGETTNLQASVRELFEKPGSEGIRKFMHGPWIQQLLYELLPDSSREERQKAVETWTRQHNPNIDENGEYPGYYD